MTDSMFKDIKDNPIKTLPAGKYVIGDLCYILPDELHNKIVVLDYPGTRVLSFQYGKQLVEMFVFFDSTFIGDGLYRDQHGHEFPVDGGVIGCVLLDNLPASLVEMMLDEDTLSDTHQFTFDESFVPYCDDGIFDIASVHIDTKHGDNDDDENDDFVDYEDDADVDDWEDFDDWDNR